MPVLALTPILGSVQGTGCPKLEHQDSNLDCPDPKSGGLPLPYTPIIDRRTVVMDTNALASLLFFRRFVVLASPIPSIDHSLLGAPRLLTYQVGERGRHPQPTPGPALFTIVCVVAPRRFPWLRLGWHTHIVVILYVPALRPGFEPRPTVPETVMLPLHHRRS